MYLCIFVSLCVEVYFELYVCIHTYASMQSCMYILIYLCVNTLFEVESVLELKIHSSRLSPRIFSSEPS